MKKDTVSRFVSVMWEKGCDAALITAPVNLFYLTGSVYNGYAYVTSGGSFISFARRKAGAPKGSVIIRKPEQIPEMLLEAGLPLPRSVMLEDEYLCHRDYKRLAKVFSEAVKIPSFIRKAREVKTPRELKLLRQSAAIQSECFGLVPSLFKPGMTDLELAADFERELRLRGHHGFCRIFGLTLESCLSTILAGNNGGKQSPYDYSLGGRGLSGAYPYSVDRTLITPGTTVMVDFCGNFNGYMTDMSRTFSFGEISPEALAAHQTAMDILEAAEKLLVPGANCEEIYAMSEKMVQKSGLRKYYMSNVQGARFLGHGTSLEINEGPVLCLGSRDKLAEGNVIAVEPKFVIPGVGPVGVEDTFIVTAKKPVSLSNYPRSIVTLG